MESHTNKNNNNSPRYSQKEVAPPLGLRNTFLSASAQNATNIPDRLLANN